VQWCCDKGHLWVAVVKGRARKYQPNGCPICSGRAEFKGVNDLQTTHPELAAEAYGWDPTTVNRGSHSKKAWWCEMGHHFSGSVKTGSTVSGVEFAQDSKYMLVLMTLLHTTPKWQRRPTVGTQAQTIRIPPFLAPPLFVAYAPRRVVVTRPKQPVFIW